MCPHTYYYTKYILGTPLSYVLILLYTCPYTIIYASSYYHICVLTQMEECRGLRSERDTLKLSAEEAVRKAQLQAQN
jgi:hypothetical protein